MKRVVVIIPHMFIGGAERVALTHALSLRKANYDVWLVIVIRQGSLVDEYQRFDNKIILDAKKVSLSGMATYKVLRKLQPDFVFSTHHTTTVLAACVKRLPMLNFYHLARVPGSPEYEKKTHYYGTLKRKVFALGLMLSDLVIAQTQKMKNEINSVFGIYMEKIHVLDNPMDTNRLKRAKRMSFSRRTLVAVGRLHEVKGFDLLIKSVKILKAQGYNFQVLIIGEDKGELEMLNKLNFDQGTNYDVSFLGPKEDVLDYVISSDGFILSSRSEGTPNALLEALSLGVPCVVTRCFDGVEKLIKDGYNGYTCEPNVFSLAEAIKSLLDARLKPKRLVIGDTQLVNLINSLNE